jgi:hypothetical protein
LLKNWLTPELVREIEACFPTKDEISNTPEGDNVRDLEAFKVKAAKLLHKGRIFVSFKLADQVSKCVLMLGPSTRFTPPSAFIVFMPNPATRNADSTTTLPNIGR